MSRNYPVLVAFAAFAMACAGAAAQTLPAITMDQALREAAASGDDQRLVAQSLGVARLQRSLDLARQGLSVSASGAYVAADGDTGPDPSGYNQQAGLIKAAESASTGGSGLSNSQGIAQSVQGGLALSTPLTKISLSATQSMAVVAPATQGVQSSVVGLTAAQTIWDGYPGGQYRATLDLSLLTLQGKELAAVQGSSAAIYKVKQAYLGMLSAQRDLDVKRQVLDKQTKLLEQLQAVFAIHQLSDIDLKTAQINQKSAEIDVTTAEKTLRLSNERLAVIMGRPADSRFTVADFADPVLPAATIEEAIRIGLERRTDLAQYQLAAKSSRINVALARAQAQPALSLTGGAGLVLGWTAEPVAAGALSLGAKVSLPILDSGAASLLIQANEGQAALSDLQAAQLSKTLASDIRDFYETAQLLAQKIDLAKQSADLAEALFQLTEAQNKYGTATTQDVLTASVTAATADENYETARSAYLSAELSLETAMGL